MSDSLEILGKIEEILYECLGFSNSNFNMEDLSIIKKDLETLKTLKENIKKIDNFILVDRRFLTPAAQISAATILKKFADIPIDNRPEGALTIEELKNGATYPRGKD